MIKNFEARGFLYQYSEEKALRFTTIKNFFVPPINIFVIWVLQTAD